MLADGKLAANGYVALRDLDSNADGVLDVSDAAFSELRVWRDLNQDGVSQTEELQSLGDAGITSIGLTSTAKNQGQNGNTITSTGTYTKTDGSTGTTANVNLAINTVTTEFTDQVGIPEELLDLPDMSGSGQVRDLQQAAALSTTLASLLTQYAAATTRDEQMALLDRILFAWADTSGMAGSLDERVAGTYKVEYLAFGNTSRGSHLQQNTTAGTVATTITNEDNPLIDDTYRNLISAWNDKIHILESFNGSYFFQVPGQSQEGGGAARGLWTAGAGSYSLAPNPGNLQTLAVSYSQGQLDLLNSAYDSLRQAVYESLLLQTRLEPYLDLIDLNITETDIALDFTRVTQAFQDKIASDQVNGITDLIEFTRYTRDILSGTQWDGVSMMEDFIRSTTLTPELEALYRDLGVSLNAGTGGNGNDNIILGDTENRSISGNNGNDILLGGGGSENIHGGNGNDIIGGGAGNDVLYGGYGDDTYIFRKGSGNDIINDGKGSNSVFFSNLNPGDITVIRGANDYADEFTFIIKETGETLQVKGGWYYNGVDRNIYNVTDAFIFADGTVWDREEALRQSVTRPTAGDDLIIGSRVDDVSTGLAGNDTLIGNQGNDVFDGGAGDDTIYGSGYTHTSQLAVSGTTEANGNDTYLFGRGDGHDLIIDADDTINNDILLFKEGIAPSDVAIRRSGDDLKLTIIDTDDSVTISRYFHEGYSSVENHDYEIENIRFSDGTVWTAADIGNQLMAGTEGADTIIAYRGDDTITGGAGNDSIDARTGNDHISGGAGNDTIRAGLGNDLIDGGAGDDLIYGSQSATTWSDTGYSDLPTDNDTYLFGFGDGHDTIVDEVWSSESNDSIRFREGVSPDDVIFQSADNNSGDLRIVLGDGSDSITVRKWFWNANCQIERFEFSDGTVLDNAWVNANLTVPGTGGNDRLTGTNQGETLDGRGGDDILNAGNGNDTLLGGEGNDSLYGEDGNDILDGGAGDDLLVGGYGNDTYRFGRGYGRDTVYEGFRNSCWVNSLEDTIEFNADVSPEDVILRRSGNDIIVTLGDADDVLTVMHGFNETSQPNRIEFMRFADGTTWDLDTMKAKALEATQGADTLVGFSSDDIMDGGAGDDLLQGKSGSDTYLFGRGSGNDVISEEWDWNSTSTDTVQFGEGITAADLEFTRLQGDLLVGIRDTGEILRITGGAYSGGMVERFTFSNGATLTWDEVIQLAAVPPTAESLVGTPGDDTLTGSDLDSTIFGLEGDDILVGAGGNDTIDGGDGNDRLEGNGGSEYLRGGNGNDSLWGGDDNDNLYGQDGDDLLSGGGGNDYLDGGMGANTYLFQEGTSLDNIQARLADGLEDTILFGEGITASDLQVQLGDERTWNIQAGDSGYGTLVVGTGDDAFSITIDNWTDIARSSIKRFVFSDGSELTLDQVIAMNDGGIAGYQSGGNADDNLVGSLAADSIQGRAGNDVIHGRAGRDYIYGDQGDDLLDGGSGDDTLDGGYGDDILVGGWGDDTLFGGSGDDVYLFNRGDGDDTILNGTAGETNTLSFGSGIAPADVSVYVNGNGELVLLVDGGIGGSLTMEWFDRDTMSPHGQLPLQRVQFVAADGSVRIFDLGGLVMDSIGALVGSDSDNAVSLFSAADAREITLSALPAGGDVAVAYAQSGDSLGVATYAASSVTSDGDDRLVGTDGNDTLNGAAGNDLIFGLDGDDYLEGGAGHDRIDAGEGNDIILGQYGDDLILAGAGNDSIFAGPGDDIVYGGFGDDTYYFNVGDGMLTIEDSYLEEVADDGYGGSIPTLVDSSASSGYGGGYGDGYGGTVTAFNVLEFGPGISHSDLSFSEHEGYLVIHILSTGDRVRLAGYDADRPTFTTAVDLFRFNDGSTVSRADILESGITFTAEAGGSELQGTPGNDTLLGSAGDDIFDAGQGNDRLVGGSGFDTYRFNQGDGVHTIVDMSVAGMENRVEFGDGILSGQLSAVIQEDGTFALRLGDGDLIRFEGYDPRIPGMPAPVGEFIFRDGSVLGFAELLARGYEILGTPEEDTLHGTSGNDRIRGLGGDDLLIGGDGDDTYLIGANEGTDTIDDLSAPGAENLVVLPEWARPDSITLGHDPDNGVLIVRKLGTNNELRLTNFDRLDPFGKRAVGYFQLGPGGVVVSYEDLIRELGFSIDGTSGDDTLVGTATGDWIMGNAGNDIIQGGTGGDWLEGGFGDDTYVFNKGDGRVSISDFLEPGAGNLLRFGPGIKADDIRQHLRFTAPAESDTGNGTFVIAFDNGDSIRLDGFTPDDVDNSPRSVDLFQFDDGTTLSFAELVRMTFVVEGDGSDNTLSGTNLGDRLYGYEGNDALNGGAGEDVLTGGIGDDLLEGGAGQDTYVFNLGDGNDRIIDAAESGIGNRILFGDGISLDDVTFSLVGTTLTVTYGNQGDRVTIENFDPSEANGSAVVDYFEFSDGFGAGYRELTNQAPVADAPLEAQSALLGQPFSYTLPEGAFVDPEGEELRYVATISGNGTEPSWLSFDPLTRTFSGIPANGDVGSVTVTVAAIDTFSGTASQSFTIDVINDNDAPVVATPLIDRSVTEDQPFSFQVPVGTFIDVDAGDQLTYNATLTNGDQLPGWLAFDATTRTFSGTPTNDNVGVVNVRVTATDLSGATADSAFNLTVINVNDAPVVPAKTATIDEDQVIQYTPSALLDFVHDIDPTHDTLTVVGVGNAEHGTVTMDEWHRVTFTPDANYNGPASFDYSVSDGNGGVTTGTVNLTITPVNDAPVVATPLTDRSATEDQPFSFRIPEDAFADVDAGDQLTYTATLATGDALPQWLSFDAAAGTFSGTPTNNDVGVTGIKVTATDARGATAESTFTINVINVNDAPVVATPLIDRSAIQDQPFCFQVPAGTFTDVDAGDQLTYSATLANGDQLPNWLAFDATTRTFSGTPDNFNVGILNVRVRATDGFGATADSSFSLAVNESAPIIYGTPGCDILLAPLCAPHVNIHALGGNDIVSGSAGNDRLLGEDGNDLISGWSGNDYMDGGSGNDILDGGSGKDLLRGGGGNDMLYGGSGDDILDGGAGADTLAGGDGNDTYLFGRGYGNDSIFELDLFNATTDTVQFTAGVSADQLWFRRVGLDLEVSVIGSDDRLNVEGWYCGSQCHVDRFRTADGRVLLDSQVNALVNAMASFATSSSGQTIPPANYPSALAPVIAANWQ